LSGRSSHRYLRLRSTRGPTGNKLVGAQGGMYTTCSVTCSFQLFRAVAIQRSRGEGRVGCGSGFWSGAVETDGDGWGWSR
jgi:hypothetical protein